MPNYGIEVNDFAFEDLIALVRAKNIPAYFILKRRIQSESLTNRRTALLKEKKLETVIQAQNFSLLGAYNNFTAVELRRALFSIRDQVGSFPIRALINPHLPPSVNKKLDMVWHDKFISDYQYYFSTSSLKINGHKFRPSDIKKMRYVLVWLNHHLNSIKRKKSPFRACLNSDYKKIFLTEGFDGLKAAATYKKRLLNKYLNQMDEIFDRNFLLLANLDFLELWNSSYFTKFDRDKLIQSVEYLSYLDDKPKQATKLPIYYLYREQINLNMNKLERLYMEGLRTLKDAQIFLIANKNLLNAKEFHEILFKNFGK